MNNIVLLNASHAPSLILFREPLIREVLRRGYSVHTTSPDFDPQTVAKLSAMGVATHHLPMARRGISPIGDLRYYLAMRTLIDRLKPRLSLNYTIKPNIWGSLAAAAGGVPSVSMITGAGFVLMTGGTRVERGARLVAQRLYGLAMRANTKVVFQNDDDINEFEAVGALRDRAKVVRVNGSGVDVDHYVVAPLPDRPVFLLIARLLASKGVREFASAGVEVRKQVPDSRFVLVGPLDPGYDGIRESEIKGWQTDGIEYLGPLSDVRTAIAEASVFVLPSSYREGTPRSVLEAMAMGRPIISTDVPGCRETVANGVNGFLVPAREVQPLIDAMLKLAGDPSLRERMGAEGRKMIEARFDVRKVNGVLLEGIGLEPLPGAV